MALCSHTLTCARDSVAYCGCDGETFYSSSTCASHAYAHEGACEDEGGAQDGFAGGENCDATQVVTDEPVPECEWNELPEVKNGTYTLECVPLNECGCETPSSQAQCGDGLKYICYKNNRCGQLT